MPIGPGEIALIAAIALLIFGPKRLPELGKALGQGIGNFKKSLSRAQNEVTDALQEESEKSKGEEPASQASAAPGSDRMNGS